MDIIPFNFKDHKIRVIQGENGEPWFVAKDVAETLGYKDAAGAVVKYCKKSMPLKYIQYLNKTPQIDQQLKLIPESDVYRLTMRSKLNSAEEFQDWVVEDVLPSIRKTGSYLVSPVLPDFTNPVIAARAWADEVEQKRTLQEQAQIDAPKVKFAEILTGSSNTRCIRVWVKGMKSDCGLRAGERDVFKWLREKKYIFKDRVLGNLPYAKYESNGLSYFSLAGFEDKQGMIRQSLQITGKGMVALTDKVIRHFSEMENAIDCNHPQQ